MTQNWIKKIIGGLSLTSAMFVFQACYGTPQDFGSDFLLEGQVKAASTGLPIPGIKVSTPNDMQYQTTNDEGKFSFYTQKSDSLKLFFEDIDSTQNSVFLPKDTLLVNAENKVFLNISLDEK